MHQHVKYLLYRNNCLILPGFGGIVLQYSPARIHPAQHIFQPPRKAIAFNRSLTTNDGLLISHLANAENLHYDDAEKRVRQFVDQIENSIRRKGEYTLTGIGRFYNDIESNLQFEPDEKENYLLNAYGLDRFVSPAIVRRDAFEPQLASDVKQKKRKFNWFGLSSMLLVLILLAVQFLSINDLSHVVRNPLAGIPLLAPLGNKTDSQTNISNSIQPTGKRDTVVQIIVIQESNDTTATASTNPVASNENTIVTTVNDGEKTEHIDTRTAEQKITDSIKLIATSKVPMRGEYNPSELGKYVIVFSNSTDSTKAMFFQKQLWKDRIGAQVLPYRKRLLVAKPGYMTASAAAKDLYIYRLLGYKTAYIQKMKTAETASL